MILSVERRKVWRLEFILLNPPVVRYVCLLVLQPLDHDELVGLHLLERFELEIEAL